MALWYNEDVNTRPLIGSLTIGRIPPAHGIALTQADVYLLDSVIDRAKGAASIGRRGGSVDWYTAAIAKGVFS